MSWNPKICLFRCTAEDPHWVRLKTSLAFDLKMCVFISINSTPCRFAEIPKLPTHIRRQTFRTKDTETRSRRNTHAELQTRSGPMKRYPVVAVWRGCSAKSLPIAFSFRRKLSKPYACKLTSSVLRYGTKNCNNNQIVFRRFLNDDKYKEMFRGQDGGGWEEEGEEKRGKKRQPWIWNIIGDFVSFPSAKETPSGFNIVTWNSRTMISDELFRKFGFSFNLMNCYERTR